MSKFFYISAALLLSLTLLGSSTIKRGPGQTVERCNASWSNVSIDADVDTALSTSKATLEYDHTDLTERDSDGCWSLPTTDNMEFRYTQSGATDSVFAFYISGTAKLDTEAAVVRQFLDTGSSGCIDGSGAANAAKKQIISFTTTTPAHRYLFFTDWPTHVGTVTIDDGDEVCINLSVTSGTPTITFRDLQVIIVRLL